MEGDEGIKTLVQVSVTEVTLRGVRLSGEGKPSQLSVCFQRGLKAVASKERELVLQGKDVTLTTPFGNETLSLVTTLVRDAKKGVFLEKNGKLVLRRVARQGGFQTGFQGIAVAHLPLHTLLADYSMQRLTLNLVDCTGCDGGTMSVIIVPKFISEASLTADSASHLSGKSDHSKSGLADFHEDSAGNGGIRSTTSASAAQHVSEALSAALQQAAAATAKEREKLLAELADWKKKAEEADTLREELAKTKAQMTDTLQQSFELLQQKDAQLQALQQHQGGAVSATSLATNGAAAEAELVDLREQLHRAAEYVAYQETIISAHVDKIAALSAAETAAPAVAAAAVAATSETAVDHEAIAAALAEMEALRSTVSALKTEHASEVARLQEEVAGMQERLSQAAEYVQHQDAQIEALQTQATAAAATAAAAAAAAAGEGATLEATQAHEEELSKLRKQLTDAAEFVSHQEMQVEELKQKLEAAAEYVNHQEAQIAALTVELEHAKTVPPPLSAAVADDEGVSSEKVAALEKEIDSLKELVQQGADYVAFQEAQLAAVQAELEESKTAHGNLLLSAGSGSVDGVVSSETEQELTSLKEQIQQAGEYVAFQESQLAALQAENAEVKQKLDAGAEYVAFQETQIGALQSENSAVQQKLSEAAEYVAHQETQLAALTAELEAAKASVLAASASSGGPSSEEIQQELADFKQKLDAAAEYVAFQDAQLAALQAELETAKTTPDVGAFEQEIATLRAQLQEGADYVAYQQSQLEALQAEQTEAKQKLDAAAEYVAHQDAQLAALQAELETAKAAVLAVSATATPLEELQARFAATEERLQAQHNEADARATSMQQELESLKEQLQQAGDYVAYQESQMAALQAEHAEAKQKLDAAAEYVTHQDAQLAALQAELETAKTSPTLQSSPGPDTAERVGLLEQEIATLRAQLQEGADYVAYQQSQLEALQAEQTEAKQKLDAAAEYVAHQDAQLAALQAELETAKAAAPLKSFTAEVAASDERVGVLEQEIASLRAQLQEGAEYVAYQESQIAALTTEAEAMRTQVAAAAVVTTPTPSLPDSHAVTNAQAETGELEKEVVSLKEQLQQAGDYVAYQDAQLAALQAELVMAKSAPPLALSQPALDPSSPPTSATRSVSSTPGSAASAATAATPTATASSAELAALEKKLQAADAFINHQSVELAKLQQQLGEGQQSRLYTKELAAAEVQAQLNEEHKKAIELLAEEIQSLKSTIKDKDIEVRGLREQVQEGREQGETFKAARKLLVAEVEELKAEVSTLHGLQDRLSEAQRTTDALVAEKAALSSEKAVLATEKATLAGEISVLQANLDAAKSFAFPSSPQHGGGSGAGALIRNTDESIIMSSPMASGNREEDEVRTPLFESSRIDHDEVVGSLIEAKMALAIKSTELDEENSKVIALQKRLQAYSSKISALETKLNEASDKTRTARSLFGGFRKHNEAAGGAGHSKGAATRGRAPAVLDDDDDL